MFGGSEKSPYLCSVKRKSRGGAVVARWAHNPKVVGSSPAPATDESRWNFVRSGFLTFLHATLLFL